MSNMFSIEVDISFPNGVNARPVVTTSTGEVDNVDDTYTGVEWELATGSPDQDGLTITGVQFYSDLAKTVPVTPVYMTMPGANNGRMNWIINFNTRGVATEQTLYYDLKFKDDHFDDLDWDPTLKVLPRGTGAPPAEQQAGAGG